MLYNRFLSTPGAALVGNGRSGDAIMTGMIVRPIRTSVFLPPKDDLFRVIQDSIKKIPDRSALVVTSKVVSISEGRCVPVSVVSDKKKLIQSEADFYLDNYRGQGISRTIKRKIIMILVAADFSKFSQAVVHAFEPVLVSL